uniref:Protein kinase domain-containing protein n=1 Tax=Globodera rostochiensis TaxID=31243 RepID=A0A914HJ43_GLORO
MVDVKIQPAQFNHGATGQVFIGYSGRNEKNLPKDKCIAIKLYGVNDHDQYVNSEKILTALNNVEMAKEHIINMLDYGKFQDPYNNLRFMTILELGKKSLDEELLRGEKRTSDELKNLIKDVMNTLVVMHKVAVHLDFKPKNLLLFKRRSFFNINAGFSIKLTDFDGSFLFMNGTKIVNVTKKDNICCTIMYAGPDLIEAREHLYNTNIITSVASTFKSLMKGGRPPSFDLTPKMDIWAAGVTIYEIVISNFFDSKDSTINQGDYEKNLINKVALINTLYSGANFYTGQGEMSPKWWDDYSGVLPNILDIWCKHKLPEIAYLLLNMMDINPAKRMTAEGVIEYLGGKCKPVHRKIALFSNVTADQLKSWIEAELNRLKMLFICQTTARKQSQKDLTKSGQEMLASAQTLLHGKKTPKTEGQKDPIKTGQELLDSAPTLFDGMKSGSFDDKEIKVKMTTLLGQFKIGIDKFNAIKIVYNQHENGLLRQRRRRKRADPTHGHDHDDHDDEEDGDVMLLVVFGGLTATQWGQPLQPLFTGVSIVMFLLLLCVSAGYYSLKD